MKIGNMFACTKISVYLNQKPNIIFLLFIYSLIPFINLKYRTMKKSLTSLLLIAAFITTGFSQSYDVRFSLDNLDCDNENLSINLEVRASSPSSVFQVAEQNYRFSYNRDALTPTSVKIAKEGDISSFILGENGQLVALYAPHNLGGSLDTVVSYNIELQGGDGLLVTDVDWTSVGTVTFDVVDTNACLNLTWHDQLLFPPTFVSTVGDTTRVAVPGSLYLNDIDFSCFSEVCAGPLPVELTSFDAINGDDCSIELEWTTATETGNDYFQIERSADGVNYTVIGVIEGSGNSSTANTYTFIDDAPSANNYYRLRQIDFVGDGSVSSQLVVKSQCFEGDRNTVEIFPNPIRGKGKIKFFNDDIVDAEVELNISDALGRIVHTEILSIGQGANLLHFNTTSLIPGAYYVQLKGSNWLSASQKIVKID